MNGVPKATWSNSSYRWMFILLSGMGSLLSASSENWLSFWVGMEVSTISFITIIVSDPGFVSKVSSWNYFVYQCVGSALLFLPLVLFQGQVPSPLLLYFGVVGASLKLGLFPLQGWVLHVIENMELLPLFLLGSVQKVAPLVAIFHLFPSAGVEFSCLLLLTACSVGFCCIGLYSVNQILALSSILMSAWLGFSLLSWSLTVLFFGVYAFHLLILLYSMSDFPFHGNVSALFQTSMGSGKAGNSLALGAFIGLPPFGIFVINMEVSSALIDSGALLPVLLMLVSSSLMLFVYMKVAIPIVMHKGFPVSWSHFSVLPVIVLFFLVVFIL